MLLRRWDQQGGLVFKDSLVPPSKDKAVAAANRLAAERDKKAREQMKKERRLKQEARDQREDVSSDDDDDDDDDDDEVVIDVDWGVLEDEDTLTSAAPPCRDPSRSTWREVSR